MKKFVQIEYQLFLKMVLYHLVDPNDEPNLKYYIELGLKDKVRDLQLQEAYKECKTATTDELKDLAMKNYLRIKKVEPI